MSLKELSLETSVELGLRIHNNSKTNPNKHGYMNTQTHTNTNIHTHKNTNIQTQTYTHIQMQTYTHTQTQTYKHKHTDTYKHTQHNQFLFQLLLNSRKTNLNASGFFLQGSNQLRSREKH